MNFALMFALALGIDYALFVVMRFRNALFGRAPDPVDAVGATMDTAGKAVLFSGLTVIVSLAAVMLVPSPAFRSVALGIMISVIFVLAATLTLLPAVLAKLGPRVDRVALPWAHSGEHRSPRFARWGELLWRRPLALRRPRPARPGRSSRCRSSAPRTGMPSIKVVPPGDHSRVGYEQLSAAFGPGAPGLLQVTAPRDEVAPGRRRTAADRGIAMALPPRRAAAASRWSKRCRPRRPRRPPSTTPSTASAPSCPRRHWSAGPPPRTATSRRRWRRRRHWSIGVVLGLGFLLLLVAFQAPLVAALGVPRPTCSRPPPPSASPSSIFQDGNLADLLGFESQGFLDAWAPVFFFAMVFAIAMDYTVFLLSSAREHWERDGQTPTRRWSAASPTPAASILAAGGVMVAVFFTFALSGPLPPKEMGAILGVAVLLDAFLVRLLLVPVLLRLTGAAAWWMPGWLRRLMPRVSFGHDGGPAPKRAEPAEPAAPVTP